jgi:hypothetical protein
MYKKHRLENNTEVPDLCSVSFEQINMALFGSVKHLIKIVGKQNARIKKLEMMLNIENDDDVDDDTYIRMYVCIIRMYVCIYVCMYIYIHILSLALSLSHTHASTYTQTHKLYIYIYRFYAEAAAAQGKYDTPEDHTPATRAADQSFERLQICGVGIFCKSQLLVQKLVNLSAQICGVGIFCKSQLLVQKLVNLSAQICGVGIFCKSRCDDVMM